MVSFLFIQLLNKLSEPSQLTYKLLTVLNYYLLYKLFRLIFFAILFIKRSKYFILIEVFHFICTRHSNFNFLITKISPNQSGLQLFAKIFLDFNILTRLPTLYFRIFIITLDIYVFTITSLSFILMFLFGYCFYQLHHVIYKYSHFFKLNSVFINFSFQYYILKYIQI